MSVSSAEGERVSTESTTCNCGCTVLERDKGYFHKCCTCGVEYHTSCCLKRYTVSKDQLPPEGLVFYRCKHCQEAFFLSDKRPSYDKRVRDCLNAQERTPWMQFFIASTNFDRLTDLFQFIRRYYSGYTVDANLDFFGKFVGRHHILRGTSKLFKVNVSDLGSHGMGLGYTLEEAVCRAIINEVRSGERRHAQYLVSIGLRQTPWGVIPKDMPDSEARENWNNFVKDLREPTSADPR